MTSRSTVTDLEPVLERSVEMARAIERHFGEPSLLYAESGQARATGCSFSRRGSDGTTWTSRWGGARAEVIGDSERRAVWCHGLDLSAIEALAAGRGLTGEVRPDEPFASTRVPVDMDDDRLVAERMVDAASGSGRFRLVEAELRRVERSVLVCRSGTEPVRRAESSLRWRLRLLLDGARDYEEWTGIGLPDLPERLAVEAAEAAQDRVGARRPAAGPAIIRLDPAAAAVWLHEVLGHTLEADYGARGGIPPRRSRERGLAVWTVPLHPGSSDDEGNPERRLELSAGEDPETLITDERWARTLRLPKTGNGRRQDYRCPVRPRIGALRGESAGDAGGEAIVRSQGEGVVLRIGLVLSGHVHPERDEFVLEVGRAERFTGGKYEGPLGRFRIRGRVSDVLDHVVAIGGEVATVDPPEWSRRLCVKDGQVLETANSCPSLLMGGVEVDPTPAFA